jgi:hypothetical protein
MIDDMLAKPPLGKALNLPMPPLNLKAHIGDEYALLTFDSQNCSRADKISSFRVTIAPDGKTRIFRAGPIRVDGLTNGKKYQFTLEAVNDKGASLPVKSNSVIPQKANSPISIDKTSKVTQLATTSYENVPTIVYGDELSRTLKIATKSKRGWNISIVRQGLNVGSISICKSKFGGRETLHIFYAELNSKDLMHSFSDGNKWKNETIDGDGTNIQKVNLFPRGKTASDVSGSNACVVTNSTIQVFYRDETEGILLGAVKTSNGWVYEIVDGDTLKNGRTTGDVAFSLKAVSNKSYVYVLYDSVLSRNSAGQTTQSEMRFATRGTVFPEDWKYKTLDGPDQGNAVAGFATAISNIKGRIIFAWLNSTSNYYPRASQLITYELRDSVTTKSIQAGNFGEIANPFVLLKDTIVFGCLTRICKLSNKEQQPKLVTGREGFGESANLIYLSGKQFLVASLKQRLVLLPI